MTLTPLRAVGAPRSALAAATTASPAATPPADPKDPFYGSRWERSFSVAPADMDRLQAVAAQHLPPETRYPNPQRVQTVYVRSTEKGRPKEKFRIRTYPDSPGPPTLLEFKDTVVKDGQKITEKVRIPVASDTNARLLWGESGASVIGTDGRTGADLLVAQRAIKVVDELNVRPAVRQEYVRTTFEDAKAGVRMTFDRGIHYTGIGELLRAGSGKREDAIMDVKVIGTTPPWLSGMIDAEMAAKRISLLEDGKGATAVHELAARLKKPAPPAPPVPAPAPTPPPAPRAAQTAA